MNKQTDSALNPAELRKHAEQEMAIHSDMLTDSLMTDEKRLLHELQVHQIELERQNESLLEALAKAVDARFAAERVSNLLTALIDISFDGYWEVDLTGHLRQVNEAYAKVSGYSVGELLNVHISQLEVNSVPDQVNAHIEKIIEQRYDIFETRHRRKDGKIIDMEIFAVYLPAFQQICCICRDITSRKQSETKLNALFNASVEGIVTCDIYNTINSANPTVETIFGYKPAELIGCRISTIISSLSNCRIECCCLPDGVKRTNQMLETEGRHKNGSMLPVELSRVEYRLNDACYFAYVIRDISLRKQQEQQDKAHLDELAHITRIGLMGEMASGIAHEVNQPLAAITSYVQASINIINSDNYNPADIADILFKVQQQALRAGQIIHRMRDFMKSHPEQRSTIDINDIAQEAVSLCIAEIKQYNINITFELGNDLPLVYADHIQIEQVLINLIRNSIDALKDLSEDRPLLLSLQTQLIDDNAIEVRVKDNGTGIDQDQQLKILMPFYTTKKTGMGMGLSICRSLIEAHKGVLRFNSKPGKGSTFYFKLPIGNGNGRN